MKLVRDPFSSKCCPHIDKFTFAEWRLNSLERKCEPGYLQLSFCGSIVIWSVLIFIYEYAANYPGNTNYIWRSHGYDNSLFISWSLVISPKSKFCLDPITLLLYSRSDSLCLIIILMYGKSFCCHCDNFCLSAMQRKVLLWEKFLKQKGLTRRLWQMTNNIWVICQAEVVFNCGTIFTLLGNKWLWSDFLIFCWE